MRRASAMPVPGVLPPTRPRRAGSSSSSTPKHPGTRAILPPLGTTRKSLGDREPFSNGSSGPTPNGIPVNHTVLSHSFFLILIYNPSSKLPFSSLSIVHCALHFAPLFFHPAFTLMCMHPFTHPWLSLFARLHRAARAHDPASGPLAPTYRVTSPSPGSRPVIAP